MPMEPLDKPALECNVNALTALLSYLPRPKHSTHEESPTEKRSLFDLTLDALAELSLYKPEESFAIALRTIPSENATRLFLASKKQISNDVILHLKSIWAELAILSRPSIRPFTEDMIYKISENRMKLICMTYSFSHAVIQARFETWWPIVKLFDKRGSIKRKLGSLFSLSSSAITEALEPPYLTDDPKALEKQLQFLIENLATCQACLGDIPIGTTVVSNLIRQSETFVEHINICTGLAVNILSKPGLCECWAAELNPQASARPALRDAIQNLIILHTRLWDLIRYAYSPGGAITFAAKLTIEIVPPAETPEVFQTYWPATYKEWANLHDHICKTYGYHNSASNSLSISTAPVLSPMGPSKPNKRLHCACSLISYLESKYPNPLPGSIIDNDTSQYMYTIGLSSNEPCQACFSWIYALNKFRDHSDVNCTQYKVRTSNGKWENDFAIPALLIDEILPTLFLLFGTLYATVNIDLTRNRNRMGKNKETEEEEEEGLVIDLEAQYGKIKDVEKAVEEALMSLKVDSGSGSAKDKAAQ
ncbi:hypothetical protein M422DRAFT_64168 [Sphaerobolus stellatus SS14]|nr:hypothetical protein M422DRAFT_64168 [Sphaerobolus stellatus SS14]